MTCVHRSYLPLVAFLLAFLGLSETKAGERSAVFLSVADTGLYEIAPTNNLGLSLAVPAGVHSGNKRSRYLIRFDPVGELPAGAIVTGVELRIQVTVAGTPACDYGVHRMLRGWVEGVKEGNNGSGATAGETTWLAQSHPDGTWTVPGGAGDVDYVASPSATASLGATGSTNYFTSEKLATDVQHWLDNPESNFGWMIRAVDETVSQTVRRIASRETEDTGPVLIVRYLPPDADNDGVMDADDQCPGTTPGSIVNSSGCCLNQLVPCDAAWANHGQYVAALAAESDEFVQAGLITRHARAELLRVAAQSDCGR